MIKYNGKEVWTTKQVADMLGVKPNKIYHTLERRNKFFKEKENFFRLDGIDVIKFAKEVRSDKNINVRINCSVCYLWTKDAIEIHKSLIVPKCTANVCERIYANIIVIKKDGLFRAFEAGDSTMENDAEFFKTPLDAVNVLLWEIEKNER